MTEKATWAERGKATKEVLLPFGFPVLILGGIYSGVLSPVEASAATVLYALILELSIFRSIKVADESASPIGHKDWLCKEAEAAIPRNEYPQVAKSRSARKSFDVAIARKEADRKGARNRGNKSSAIMNTSRGETNMSKLRKLFVIILVLNT
ncbi:TRAP transporter large permease subunit [Brevibacillus humidisoli]|uniref:TRAP transporter large permease subunit n=1 Tax=Brevibacillus humidisoli TaxID=2895522 RepID=UPI001E43DD1F|nr:TRAP transporter large permease subunit [Brevibacillus humidisoli]